jgi:hypothetical protein
MSIAAERANVELAEILAASLRAVTAWDTAARVGDQKAATEAEKMIETCRYRLRRLASRQGIVR